MSSPSTLAVVIHGWKGGAKSIDDVVRLVRAEVGTNCEICTPKLGFHHTLAAVRATELVHRVLIAVDEAVAKRSFERIILIGHSVGATIARRAFLVAWGAPANIRVESDLAGEQPRSWAQQVERIVLIASFNRGWAVSERLGWRYAIGFNIVGLLGHLSPRAWVPGIFDFRLGAPFMAQTRLSWLAHRRQCQTNKVDLPIVVQVIGTKDDLISPFDQVDISVDGTQRSLVATAGATKMQVTQVPHQMRDYFLLEMADSNHSTAVVLFDKKRRPNARYAVLRAAVTSSRADLDAVAIDPGLLADEVAQVDETVRNTVFVIHGIRDDGFWTHRIAERVRQKAGNASEVAFRSWTPTYGYFAMLPFMLPWIRQQKVEWFADQYVSAFAQYPNSHFHYVGHSNGTYLAARAFVDYPAFHLKHVLFAGSVVPSRFDWTGLLRDDRVIRVQNIVASRDWVVALFPKGVEGLMPDLGGAGVDGFAGAAAPGFNELRYVRGSHGAGIVEAHWQQIASFIVDGTPVASDASKRFTDRPNRFFKVLGELRIVLPLLLVVFLVAIPAFIAGDWSAWRVVVLAFYVALLRFLILRF